MAFFEMVDLECLVGFHSRVWVASFILIILKLVQMVVPLSFKARVVLQVCQNQLVSRVVRVLSL
jgi:hypothetical protein